MNGFAKWAAVTGIAACGFASTAHANLLVNPGFETGDFTGWTLTGNPGFIGITGDAYAGSYAAYFGAIGSLTFLSQTIAETAGKTYSLGGFLLNFGGTPSEFDIEVNGVTLLDKINLGAQFYTLESVLFVGTGSDTITFSFRQDPSYFYFDNAFVDAPEPASLALLSTGLLGVGLARRRRARRAGAAVQSQIPEQA